MKPGPASRTLRPLRHLIVYEPYALHFASYEFKTSYFDVTYSSEVSFPTVTLTAKYSTLALRLAP